MLSLRKKIYRVLGIYMFIFSIMKKLFMMMFFILFSQIFLQTAFWLNFWWSTVQEAVVAEKSTIEKISNMVNIFTILITVINALIFAWVLKIVVNNSGKILEYKTALMYSLVFFVFSLLWDYTIGYLFPSLGIWSLPVFLTITAAYAFWWIAVYIFWKFIVQDSFTSFWLLICTILAYILLLFIIIIVFGYVLGIIITTFDINIPFLQ